MSKGQKIRLVVYLVAFLCAVAAPVWKIASIEIAGKSSPLFLFKVEGYDPYDPMRGRYLRLNQHRTIRIKSSEDGNAFMEYWNDTGYDQVIYAVLEADEEGKVEFNRFVKTREEASGKPVLKVRNRGVHYDWTSDSNDYGTESQDILFDIYLPFGKYFISESIADEADRILADTRTSDKAYLAVKVLSDGSFAVQDLLIDGVPIAQVVSERMDQK